MIPKIIHYCWFGGNPLPEPAQKCIASWKKYCPDYEIKEWNESNYDISSAPLYVRQAYEAKRWGFVPDYIRLELIYNYGGIYMDTDVELIKPLDDLLVNQGYAGFENDQFINFGLGFGAEAGNSVLAYLMESYTDLSFLKGDGTPNLVPSPILNTHSLSNIGLLQDNSLQSIDKFVFYPKDFFAAKDFATGIITITKNTFSIHHFDGSWVTDEDRAELKAHQKKEKRIIRQQKLDYFIHFPNRLAKKVLGEKMYSKVKRFFGR